MFEGRELDDAHEGVGGADDEPTDVSGGQDVTDVVRHHHLDTPRVPVHRDLTRDVRPGRSAWEDREWWWAPPATIDAAHRVMA